MFIYPVSSTEGFTYIIGSTDGGKNWSYFPENNIKLDDKDWTDAFKFSFIDSNLIFAAVQKINPFENGQGEYFEYVELLKSTDEKQSWEHVAFFLDDLKIKTDVDFLKFFNHQEGIIQCWHNGYSLIYKNHGMKYSCS